jgi:hypothetical protein
MNNVTEIGALLRQQAELEFRILAGRAEVSSRTPKPSDRRRALQRTPDAVSVQDVTAFGGSH